VSEIGTKFSLQVRKRPLDVLDEGGKMTSKTYRMGSFGLGILIPDGDQGSLVFSCQQMREYEEYLEELGDYYLPPTQKKYISCI